MYPPSSSARDSFSSAVEVSNLKAATNRPPRVIPRTNMFPKRVAKTSGRSTNSSAAGDSDGSSIESVSSSIFDVIAMNNDVFWTFELDA